MQTFDSFSGIRHFKKSYRFDQKWPYNDNISVKLKQNVKICQNIDKMVSSQFALLNLMKLKFCL